MGATTAVRQDNGIGGPSDFNDTVNSSNIEGLEIEGGGLIHGDASMQNADWRSTAKVTCQIAWPIFSMIVKVTSALAAIQAVFTGGIAGIIIWLANDSQYTLSVVNTLINTMIGTIAVGVAVGGALGAQRAIKIYQDYKKTSYAQMTDVGLGQPEAIIDTVTTEEKPQPIVKPQSTESLVSSASGTAVAGAGISEAPKAGS